MAITISCCRRANGVGFMAFIVVAVWFLVSSSADMEWQEKVVFSAFFSGAILCLGFSWMFHTVYCHSEKVGRIFCKSVYKLHSLTSILFNSILDLIRIQIVAADSIRDSNLNRSRWFDSRFDSNGNFRFAGLDLPRQQWSLLNRFRTEQGHCDACRRKWQLTDTDLCLCGETQTMSHIVESCPLTKLNGSLSRLHSADEDAVSCLTNYG